MTRAFRGDISSTAGIDSIRRTIANYPFVTCDVFDTAIMRRLARPEDVHLATGARAAAHGMTPCSPECFRDYRISAEHDLRAALPRGDDAEIPIAAIYRRLQEAGVVTDAVAAANLEFQVERAICLPVTAVRAALAQLDPTQRLIFLSDTTLPGEWLATILADCGYGNCQVISSADAGCTKAAGGLFRRVLATLGCRPEKIIHIGDNRISDDVRPREFGMATLYIQPPRIPPEPESAARQPHVVRLALSQQRARPTLVAPANHDAADGVLDDPCLQRACLFPLIGFSLFILAEAQRLGIRRIYFLSRDGHLPLAIVRKLLARRNDPLELCYLQCSRQAIAVPMLLDDMPALARRIAEALADRPLHTALSCIGLSSETTRGMARSAGLDPEQPVHGTDEGRERVARLLTSHEQQIVALLSDRREAAQAYLRQTGFMQPGRRMIVDVGWRGSLQKALTQLCEAPAGDIFGCYLGLWADALSGHLRLEDASAYLFKFGSPKWIADIVRQGYILFELFLSSPDASVSHYTQRDGAVQPVHASETEPGASIRRRAFTKIERRCLAEFDALDAMLDGAWPDKLDPDAAMSQMMPLLTRPRARDVASINRIPYVHGLDGALNAPPVNPMAMRNLLTSPSRALARVANSPWPAGTLRATLPRTLPDVGFPEFRDRFERLRRLLHV